ncbi:MAG: hypothetical protein HY255_08460 [Betaproteobacteria bacterium]|nr:hypothetical protein [Betaproteobacteria bacterium]
MKKLIATLLFALPFIAGGAYAEDKKPLTPQQEKMAKCSAESKGLKGDEYKKKHSECLKGDAAPAKAAAPTKAAEPAKAAEAAKPMTQQEKMAKCSAESKGLKGDEYKKKHSECLKG